MWPSASGGDFPPSSQAVLDYILDLIEDLRLMPGEPLYETALASELGMGRTGVRNALTFLEGTGFLESEPRKRGYRMPALSAQDMEDVFSMRALLEGEAASAAARKATLDDVAYLRHLNEMEESFALSDLPREYRSINLEFHCSIVRIGGNGYLERAFHPVFWRSRLYIMYVGRFQPLVAPADQGVTNTPLEHRRIIDAIESRDQEGAKEAALAHLRDTRAFRLSLDGDRAAKVLSGRIKAEGIE
ncbi:GntR family transcriptional regulator [Dethiosulfovibrio salsuginis]|uniref:Transcriptional regulator, GntR family n=1 Tax=Dethiosulfovibrio salsuginis TaxID=561720 RepID=A0A1X7J4E4_9BACT|nr:GntR family transcriptional regulator [Dethiosulfovibrio salsuginis]SMG22601.1 transcriptional regulator, GntR family [Dethiosulfovibrio salsuginis]